MIPNATTQTPDTRRFAVCLNDPTGAPVAEGLTLEDARDERERWASAWPDFLFVIREEKEQST